MKESHCKQLDIGSWDCRIIMAMGGTPSDAEQLTERAFGASPDQSTVHAEVSTGGEIGAFHYFEGFKGGTLWVEEMPDTPETISVLAHEATHASNHILGMCGVMIDASIMNDEPQAYLVQHIMRSFMAWAWQIKSEKKQKTA